jgi:hypothetical protein
MDPNTQAATFKALVGQRRPETHPSWKMIFGVNVTVPGILRPIRLTFRDLISMISTAQLAVRTIHVEIKRLAFGSKHPV